MNDTRHAGKTRPISQTWDIGSDAHGRPVLLVHRDGQFEIHSQPLNQRDEGERCFGLLGPNLEAMAEIARSLR